jgi:hypothetical protein
MLQSLDTLIAFVVILLTTSLLVTILVQMLSSAFALRGKNLGNALALTFQSIDPTIGANAYKLAERVLADPRLSDSLFANKKAGKTVNPNQDAPWGWWSLGKGWQLAGDIRPDEIHQLLTKISASADDKLARISPTWYAKIATAAKNLLTKPRVPATGVAGTLATAATNLLAKLRVPDTDVAKARSDLAAIQTSVNTLADSAEKTAVTDAIATATASLQSVADRVPAADGGGTLATAATNLLAKLRVPDTDVAKARSDLAAIQTSANTLADSAQKTAVTTAVTTATASLQSVEDHIATELDSLAQHFNAAHDRAQQWFQMHTRIFTIACGILLAFLLQLDSVEIFKFVSTNAAARAALVGGADKLVEKAGGIVKNSGSIIDSIYKAETAKFPTVKLTPEALKSATNTSLLRDEFKKALGDPTPGDFDTKYETAEKAGIDAYYTEHRQQLDDLTKRVAATGFDLLPTNNLFQRWGGYWETFWSHFLGMAITAGLLSLGAPFWYNSLKDLMSLRPAVSKLIGKEDAAQTQASAQTPTKK